MAPAVEPAGPGRRSPRTDGAWMQPKADIDPEATSSAHLLAKPISGILIINFGLQRVRTRVQPVS